ncbi:MAG: hypothetical protein NZM25_01735 [Leptospiraceae bacterium]|nr:hypothetical protein [Leptospiraceae bacterium]MDW8306896.1 hypothetical protein [Leptospiraceae bacterium]
MTKKWILSFVLAFYFNLYGFNPADYAPAENEIYGEIAPLEVATEQIKGFLVELTGAALFETLQAQLSLRLGFDLFNHEELTNMGFDIKTPWGFSGSWGKEPSFSLYIPTKDSLKLYQILRNLAEQEANSQHSSQKLTTDEEFQDMEEGNPSAFSKLPKEFQEIKVNELFTLKEGNQIAYVARTNKFVFVSNEPQFSESKLQPAAKPISSESYYATLKEYYRRKNGGKIPLGSLYLHPSTLRRIEEQNFPIYGEALSQALLEEMEKNIEGIGGFWGFESKKTILSFAYLYRKGYLRDKNFLLARILQTTGQKITLQFFPELPVLYLALNINLPPLIDFMIEKDPQLRDNLKTTRDKLAQDFPWDIAKDLLRAFSGNIAALVAKLPPEKNLRDYEAWVWYANFGIIPEKKAVLKDFLDALVRTRKRQKNPEFSVSLRKVQGQELYILSYTPQKGKAMRIYLLFSGNEILLSGNENIGKIPTGSKHLVREITGYENPNAFFYVNLSAIIDFLAKSNMKAFILPYLPYLRSFSSLHMVSGSETDITFSDFVIRLK